MSLHPKDFSVVPKQTAQVARAAFSKGNPYMTLRDELGVIYFSWFPRTDCQIVNSETGEP